MNLSAENVAVLFDASRRQWLLFRRPRAVFVARTLEAVLPTLAEVEHRVESGACAAGFVSYEAAPALDSALHVRPDGDFPLAWFGIYDRPEPIELPCVSPVDLPPIPWAATISEQDYAAAIARIKHYIAQGDTYQVNFSYRLRAAWNQDAWPFFVRLALTQAGDYGAMIHTGPWIVASASPELFFRLEGRQLMSRPMKGTAPRGLRQADDLARADWLRSSEKNRAENVMIVDMVRNDIGRVAELGSVGVTRLFDVAKYPSLWQMTSTVAASTGAGLVDLMRAMFPAASITGAPKARTMQIIAELETSPRRIYTGTIGYMAPGRVAQFNVAIRTVLVDLERGLAEYGVGGGIVWDSQPADEFQECRTKSRVLTEFPPPQELLETMRWTPDEGLFLLEEHLERLAASAAYFSWPVDPAAIRRNLQAATARLAATPHRVRLLLAQDGQTRIECRPLEPLPSPYRVCLARRPVVSADRLLYHKTTRRAVYDHARSGAAGCDDALLWNERGELTESTIANLVVELDGQCLTPPVECGLLPGVYRAKLLAEGRLAERVLTPADLRRASKVCLVNSVRGLWQATWEGREGA